LLAGYAQSITKHPASAGCLFMGYWRRIGITDWLCWGATEMLSAGQSMTKHPVLAGCLFMGYWRWIGITDWLR
jgi:hypothetical protein